MFDKEVLQTYVDAKLITKRKHPDFDLFIYNYTQTVQYGKLWDEITLACRGLILNGEGKVIARPFPKFFNLEEHQRTDLPELPNIDFEVYDKMDGSLGIVYLRPDDTWSIATRGSFTSPQALKGQELLEYYNTAELRKEFTYLFEIIYPENRIVVNYGDEERLVLLDVIHNLTGIGFGPDGFRRYGFDVVKKYDGVKDFSTAREKFSGENKEGFVIRFIDGTRVKLKFEEYVRLHKIIAQATPLHVWEILSAGGNISDFMLKLPDEIYKDVDKMERSLLEDFAYIRELSLWDIEKWDALGALEGDRSRKAAAEFFKKCDYPDVLFKMLDNKDYKDLIWKKIRPRGDV